MEVEAAGIDISSTIHTKMQRMYGSITQQLGYETYNLYGISYGTKLALETMRVVPEGLRSVIIDGCGTTVGASLRCLWPQAE